MMKRRTSFAFSLLFGLLAAWPFCADTTAQEAKVTPLRQADERYKADILVVVAHPDDEGAAAAYLARAMDGGKRAAVVLCTRGGSGANEAGGEQAGALAAVREIEARRAIAMMGITNVWFLDGKDTASQNVLQSLSNWNHGEALQQLVRLMRLTRPEIVMTFLPGTFVGENHGDHQASGVLATEAFDLSGDPTAFPEQVAGPTKRLESLLDNLRPWQPKKIYYFPDADNDKLFRGLGPEISVKETSKALKRPYWRVAMDEYLMHETQSKSMGDAVKAMSDAQIEKMVGEQGWTESQHFVRGKSVVGGAVTGDIFENVTGDPAPFSPPERARDGAQNGLAVELAGQWSFYGDFRRAHGLSHLLHPEPPELALQAGTTLVIPLWVRNPTASTQEITLTVDAPAGWTVQSGAGKFSIGAKQVGATRVEISLPATTDGAKKNELQEVTVRGEAGGKSVGAAKLRVELRKRAMPE